MTALRTAMVLAAGRGERMRPLTDTMPKPLVRIAGRTMLDRMLDALDRFGVSRVVVNAHHHPSQIENLVAGRTRPPIEVSLESERLETGGGIRKALPRLGPHAFLATNSDLVLPGAHRAFRVLEQHWDARAMDALLLLVPRTAAAGYTGSGDFEFAHAPTGAAPLVRTGSDVQPYVYTGVQVLSPDLFADTPLGPFPLGLLYRRALKRRTLFGIVHRGSWFHVGTPAAICDTERLLASADAAP